MTYPGHSKAILKLGLPLIGGHLGQVAIGVTDSVMLGWYGIEELAAVTLGGSFFFILFLLGAGFAWSVMPMVATFAAEEDERSIRRVTRMGLWLSILFSVAVIPLMLSATPILKALGQVPETSDLAGAYLKIAAWGIFPALMVMTIKSYLAALERAQFVFWVTMIAAVSNGIANYALIFGNWGFPELGISGAAIASVVTSLVSLLGVWIYAVRRLPEHALFQRFWVPDWEMMRRVFRLGVPIGLTTLSEAGLFTASAFMMGWLGTVPLAAHGVVLNIASVTFMAHLGLSNVATIRVGNALGRRDKEHLVRGARMVIVMSIGFALFTVIGFLLFPEPLILLWRPEESARAEILAVGVGLLAMAALFQLTDGAQAVALGLLRGAQDTRAPMWLAAVAYWGIGMPTSYIFGFVLGWDGIGIWLGMSLGLGAAAVFLNLRFWAVTLPRINCD